MAVFGKRWSNAELSMLKTSEDIKELARMLPDRTEGAIRSKIAQLKKDPVFKEPNTPWDQEELDQFPTEKEVNKSILYALADQLGRDRNYLWKKMKSLGYVWVKSETLKPTEDNPYPMHGLKWTAEELALFPKEKEVNKDILEKVQALIPLRKPSSIWPKMSKEGYVWVNDEPEVTEQQVVKGLSKDELYILSLAYELGFRKPESGSISLEPQLTNVEDHRGEIAKKFYLPNDFTSTDLFLALNARITPFPWEMEPLEEVQTAYRNRDQASILEAAKALHSKLERFING